jgi:hypothetical protein
VIAEPAQRGVAEILELFPQETAAQNPLQPREAPRSEDVPMSHLRVAGVGLAGAGVASLLFAGGASLRALSKNSDAKGNCAPSCNPTGAQERAVASEAAKFATIGAVAGGVLGVAGVALFVLGTPKAKDANHAQWSLGIHYGGLELRRGF